MWAWVCPSVWNDSSPVGIKRTLRDVQGTRDSRIVSYDRCGASRVEASIVRAE